MIITITPPDKKSQNEPKWDARPQIFRATPVEAMRYQLRAQYGIRGYYNLPELFKDALTEHAGALVEQKTLCRDLALAEQELRVKKDALDKLDAESNDKVEDIYVDDKEDIVKICYFSEDRMRAEGALRQAEGSCMKIKNALSRANENVDETKSELLDYLAIYPKFHIDRVEEKAEEINEMSKNDLRM